MNENDNGGNMELKVSTDKKIVKMFRRLEEFLDSEGLTDAKSVDFQNVETGRVFATFVTPNSFREFLQGLALLKEDLADALETIDILEDDNALLALIDAQNDVLMGRCEPYQERGKAEAEYYGASPTLEEALRWGRTGNDVAEGPEPGWPTDGVCGDDECSCRTTEASSPETAGFEGMGSIFESIGVDTSNFAVERVSVTLQEYEELLNLRQKRVRNKQTITELNATVREYKKGTETLQGQRDTNLALMAAERARADYFKQALEGLLADFSLPTMPFPADADGVTRWIR